MKEKKLTIIINKPVADVFAFTINPENTPKWIDGIVAEETNETPARLGTIFRNKGKSGNWNEYKMTSFVEHKTFELSRINGDYHVRYTFTAVNDDTCEFEYYEWVGHGELDDTITQDVLKKLKTIIEQATERYFDRVDFDGDLAKPLADIAVAFNLGKYRSHEPILLGYEDLNVRLETTDATFFVKFFLKDRTDSECERYARVMQTVVAAGVNHPIVSTADGKAIYKPGGTNLRVSVMQWLDGIKDFDKDRPTDGELARLVEQTTRINQVDIQLSDTDFIYDYWSISNFPAEYKKWQHVVNTEDKALIEPALRDYEAIDTKSLPLAFVHGDLIRTNVIKTKDRLYVFDFAVSNIYPRVQELAVLLCDMFFDPKSEEETSRLYNLLLDEYQKHIALTHEELKALPAFVRAAHAMHVLGATRGEAQGEGGDENDMWWQLGKAGLNMKVYENK